MAEHYSKRLKRERDEAVEKAGIASDALQFIARGKAMDARRTAHKTLKRMQIVGEAFDKLDGDARERIIEWLHCRYDLNDYCDHCKCDCEFCDGCG